MSFRRTIGPISLLLTAMGGIIGSGWLFGPLYASQIAGPAAIVSWAIGGILMIFIALTFAELATTFPVAGGMVRFGHFSHGPIVSFAIGWMIWLSSVVVAPIETLALLQYASNYLPNLIHEVAGKPTLTSFGIGIAAVLMLIMCICNWFGAKFFSRSSNLIVIFKLTVPILTALVLLTVDFHSSNFSVAGDFSPYGWKGIVAALPLGGVIFSFIGYSPTIQLAGETQNPKRAIPLAILGSLGCCILLYILLQVAFIGALDPSYLSHGWQHLSFKGESGPFAGILTAIGIGWLVMIIYADALISPFGTAYIYTTATARIGYAMSKNGFFPQILQNLNRHAVPMQAIAINYVAGLFLFLPFPGWQDMVTFLISAFVMSYSIGPIALLTMRYSQPEQPRPFILPYPHIFTLIAFYICNLLFFWTGWHTISKFLVAISLGFVIFLYQCIKPNNHHWLNSWRAAWWLLPYIAGIGFISYTGSFGGGHNLLPFGPDFLVIGIFTISIFILAVRAGAYHLTAKSVLADTANT